MEFAEIGKAEVNRDHRNRQRREKLQYGGGEKGEAQHFHGALAKIGGGGGDSGGFRFGAMKQAQGLASAQPVEEIAAEARQRDKVAAVGVGRAHADQRHKQRDQRRGAQQNQTGRPVERENGQQNAQGDQRRQRHLRQIARVIVLHLLDLLQQQRRPTARRFAADPRRAERGEAIQHLLTQRLANRLAGAKACGLARIIKQRAQRKAEQQKGEGEKQISARPLFDNQRLQQKGEQPGLGDNRQRARQSKQRGQSQPAAAVSALLAQPAGQFLLPGFVHARP